jgi:hypothetical protein
LISKAFSVCNTVKRAIHDLVNAKYLRKEAAYRDNGSMTSNRYHILRYAELGQNR